VGAQVRERPDKIHSALAASGESHSGSASLALESLQGLEIIELADIIPTAPIRSNVLDRGVDQAPGSEPVCL